ncbi:hypothetical protein [Bartonella phoceensis]|uniref:hypothetical protein n=1 Tax=Bartonella phoceensis TaxID=270249 RepID=UPI001ABB68A1|nr:hypothetical protein [Bartonella phoceensis]
MNGSITIGSTQHLNSISNTNDPNKETNKDLNHRIKALGENAIAIGSEAFASGSKSLAIGVLAKSEQEDVISIGTDSSAFAKMSVALGVESQAATESGVAIGTHFLADIAGYNPLRKDKSKDPSSVWKSRLSAVSVGNKSQMLSRKITSVAAGSEDADAVNFGQLQKIEKQVKEQVVASSFVKQDDTTRYITIGKYTDGDKIDITNHKSEKRIFASIKDGNILKDSNTAITGSQLFTTNQNVITASNNLQTAATNIAETFGGGAGYQDGEWMVPTFTLKAIKEDSTEEEKTIRVQQKCLLELAHLSKIFRIKLPMISPTRLLKQKVMLYYGARIIRHLSSSVVQVKKRPIARLTFLPMMALLKTQVMQSMVSSFIR